MQIESAELLNKSPLGIITTNHDQRITSCNARFLEDSGLNKAQVVGELYASLPLEAIDQKGYLIQQFEESSPQLKKYHYWVALSDQGDQIHYFSLIRDNSKKSMNIHSSKIPKRPNWVEFLEYEVSRSRRYDNPLCLLKLQVIINNQPESVDDEDIRQSIKDTLMDELRWADMIGNTTHGSFLMVLPETPQSALDQLSEKVGKAIKAQLSYLSKELQPDVVFGSAYWQKHDDGTKMLARARKNLVKKLEEKINKIK
jgi:hypothetical protein